MTDCINCYYSPTAFLAEGFAQIPEAHSLASLATK